MQTCVTCPKCGRSFQVPPELLGKRLRCLQCQDVFTAQSAPAPETALQSVPLAQPLPAVLPLAEGSSPRRERSIQKTDHGIPGYLWPFAALPWGLLLLALGGCIWGLLAGLAAAGLSAAGLVLIQVRRWPVAVRLGALLALDGLAAMLLIGGGLLALALSAPTSSGPGLASGPKTRTQTRQSIPLPPAPAAPLPPAPAAPLPLPPAPAASLPPAPRALFERGPRVFLSDLEEFGVVAGPWPFTKNGRLSDGRAIQLGGIASPKGLCMHPPGAPGFASVRFRLGRQAAGFHATVAINDTTNWCFSPAIFTVLGDDKPLWQSVWIAHNHTHSQTCSVSISGVDVLELRVQCVNGNVGVHAVWIEPRLLQKEDTPDQ